MELTWKKNKNVVRVGIKVDASNVVDESHFELERTSTKKANGKKERMRVRM